MEIKVYGKKNCSGCDQAKALLDSKGIGYQYVDVMTSSSAQQLFREKGWRTVPQISIDGEWIGGYNELKAKIA